MLRGGQRHAGDIGKGTDVKELGQFMRSAREAKGVSLEQASAETRIRRSYIDAMEDGDFRMFPGAAYATGFLRNYATYLGLNRDEVLQTYHAMSPPAGISIAPATTVGVERLRRKSRRRLVWSLISLMTAVLGAYAIKYYNDQSQTPSAGHVSRNPFTTSTIPSVNGNRHSRDTGDQAPRLIAPSAVIRVHARRTAWVHVMKNGQQVYWGPLAAGSSKKWRGRSLSLGTHRGRALKVWVNGTRAWRISHARGRVLLVARPYTWYRKR